MLANLAEDLRRCGDTPYRRIREMLFTPGMWAVVGYRFRRWLRLSRIPQPFRLFTNLLSLFAQLATEVLTNIELPSSVEIGPGLYIPHTGYIVVSSGATIGSHCTLTQGVTIGHAGGGANSRGGCPVLGDRVYVGPGSAVIGPITVGHDALIGVGAVVIRSVPPRGVAVGNPARVISLGGSFDLIEYPGMERDPARVSSMAEASREPAECVSSSC